ncbi:glycerol-3-phosphate dehydrogenase/oxidase [Fervidibacillus halotolerans]|uniref:Glycerol-3-phosphate dehydrogenase n=2 Tax=Fervidibacillus halotolerans TaxID=2980027 RepID=A0A9E8S060_9BACI|nr:glycerol-3-phosphate dehydrogenase/oxidase [Fervidibacillus halotolerans]
MKVNHYDLAVIGGGITGAGIALDAVLRGMKVALVEMQDFASGTSSRSTKLVHGGLRYLKQMQVGLVSEVGKERAIVYENGPHVTTPEWMLLPIYNDGTFGKMSTSLGLRVYDYLARVKRSERRKMLTREEVIEKEPLLKKDGLLGGGYYVEYRTDDARLTIEVLKKAFEKGADLINYVKVEELTYENNQVQGILCKDRLTNDTFHIQAKIVVNAAGPWVDSIRELDQSKKNKRLQLTKGVHIVFDQSKFPLKQAVYFDTPDGRMIFAIPRDGKTYVGTTDTFYEGDPALTRVELADKQYLIRAIQFMFPHLAIGLEDIESSWAGVRPLIYEEGKDPSEISRKDEIWESESGLISIAGGKLTGYRKMAENVVNLVAKKHEQLGTTFGPCITKQTPISGGDIGGSNHFSSFISEMGKEGQNYGFSKEEGEYLGKIYGSNAPVVFQYGMLYQSEETDLSPVVYARLMYAMEHEMIVHPSDFFIRRTGALYFQIDWVRKWKDQVIQFMAKQFHWTDEQTERYKKEFEEELTYAVRAIDEN